MDESVRGGTLGEGLIFDQTQPGDEAVAIALASVLGTTRIGHLFTVPRAQRGA